jgi:hypothetical protein
MKMTRGRGNMRIFHQIWLFSKVLIVWGAEIEVLVVCGARHKTSSNLEG